MIPIEQRQFQRGGLTFHYGVVGQGPPLVLLHGGGSRASHFHAVMQALASDYTVYAYDMRGFGDTGLAPGEPFGHQTWADDVGGFLDHLDLPAAAISGWSLGATVAMNYASQNPDRVTALVLMGAPHPDRPIDRAYFHRRLDMVKAGATAQDVVDQTFQTVTNMFSPWTLEHRPQALEQVRQEQLGNRVERVEPLVGAYESRPPFGPMLERIRCPVAIIAGDADPGGIRGAGGLSERLPVTHVEMIADCGHYYAVEQPRATAEAMRRCLRWAQAQPRLA
jgi:pimeloyl-ACP methyl ester carboxylesterase